MKKKIAILGSTGSIGQNLLKIISRDKEQYEIVLLAANKNYLELLKQAKKFKVKNIIITDNECFKKIKKKNNIKHINIYKDFESYKKIFKKKIQYVMSSISGTDGLIPTIKIIKHTKKIAIANKESIICAWNLIDRELKKYKTSFVPVDSEHFSLWYALGNTANSKVEKIYLTASGGPLLNIKKLNLKNIKLSQALKHPNWSMGKKISIDSATMINKALEIIEASVLFNLKSEQIDVVIHPQSIVHGLVHYKDGSIIANLGCPDMITPISVALSWPNRLNLNLKKFSLIDVANLSFFKPDLIKFPGLKLGWDALDNPSCSPVVLNAANEIAVESFLDNKIKFTDIVNVIFEILNIYSPISPSKISDVIEIDKLARSKTLNYIKGFN